MIKHDGHEFIFEGFSLFSHTKLDPNLPQCKVIRFNIEYSIIYVEEKFPENFTVRGLELFTEFLFKEILELVDLQFHAHNDKDGCPIFHLMPRFSRALEGATSLTWTLGFDFTYVHLKHLYFVLQIMEKRFFR